MKQKIIMLMTFLLIGAGFVMAQTQVQGTVVDEQGEPVIGGAQERPYERNGDRYGR